jgi:transposase InsO family protein
LQRLRREVEQLKQERAFRVTTDSSHGRPVAENHLGRQFQVEKPNTVWAGDITYIPTAQGWLYLAVVLDLDWSMRENLEREVVLGALSMALGQRSSTAGLLAHSDRGSQYTSADYQELLVERGVRCSMRQNGDC